MNTVLNVFSDSDELPAGTSLMQGHFSIIRPIHSGGFGIAYLASDRSGAKVVIKECFPERFCKRTGTMVVPMSKNDRSDFKAIQKQFRNEANVLARLDHANVIGIQNVFDENGTSYMVLDHIEGRDLLDVISSQNTLTPHQIINILRDTLKALAYVHEQGYLHCDIAPDNIIVTEDLTPVLIDFGTARPIVIEDMFDAPIMRTAKDGYSPQEFYVAGGTTGAFSDIYSTAASFYQIITGQTPVPAQERLKAISRQKPDPYQPLATLTSKYSDAFCEALDGALAAFPRKRPQAVEDWLEEIVPTEPEAEVLFFPHAHTHSPKGTSIYRSPSQ